MFFILYNLNFKKIFIFAIGFNLLRRYISLYILEMCIKFETLNSVMFNLKLLLHFDKYGDAHLVFKIKTILSFGGMLGK